MTADTTAPYIIPITAIHEGRRARTAENYGDIDSLSESLRLLGSIQPIVLSCRDMTAADPQFDLVAGGRRFRAMQQNGVGKLYHGSTLDPARMGFVFADEVPEHTLREAELEENVQRLEMSWQDRVLAVWKIHRSKKDIDPKWGQAQTGALLNQTAANINYSLRVAKALLARDAEIAACHHLDAALVVLTKRKEDEALAELQRLNAQRQVQKAKDVGAARATAEAVTSPVYSIGSLIDEPTVPPTNTPLVQVPLSQQFFCRDSILDMTPWPKVHHVVTDIPYGIDMDNLEGVEDVAPEHDVDQNVGMMKTFLLRAFAAVRPGGFCVFFYDLDHHEKLQLWSSEAGWRVQRWPYIATKLSACRNQAAQYNTTKNYEVAMFLRKDNQTVLRRPVASSWKAYDFAAERKLYNNPFAKPFALWKDIYNIISFPGQSVLDPYAGEMSACRAAANCGLVPYGIELKEQHFNRGLDHMKKVYAAIHSSNCEFV